MALNKEIPSYSEVYDFNYRAVNDQIDNLQSHLEFLVSNGIVFESEVKGDSILRKFEDVQGLIGQIIGNNDINDYVQMDEYEYIVHPNDVARKFLRGERKSVMKIIRKDTYTPGKQNALDILSKFVESGDLKLFQNEETFEKVSFKSTENLIKKLSTLPVSLGDIVLQERRDND